jgi:hypothetical protein
VQESSGGLDVPRLGLVVQLQSAYCDLKPEGRHCKNAGERTAIIAMTKLPEARLRVTTAESVTVLRPSRGAHRFFLGTQSTYPMRMTTMATDANTGASLHAWMRHARDQGS